MIVKLFITLDVDEEEYPVPVDGLLDEEIKEAFEEFVYDVDGLSIRTFKMLTE